MLVAAAASLERSNSMKSLALFAAICAMALSAGGTKTANAATITETIDFTATGFLPAFDLNGVQHQPPVDPVIGSLTITFDNSTPTGCNALDCFTITLGSVNIPPNAAAGPFGPPEFQFSGTTLEVCGTSPCGLGKPWILTIHNFPVAPTFGEFDYAQLFTGLPGPFPNQFVEFVSFDGSVSIIPLPAALPLFASGLGALGLLGWRRKKKATTLNA
jgi:hypothetical protein